MKLIPPGTKAVVRGNKFNYFIKTHILSLQFDNSIFEICFEKKSNIYVTSEIPDWYILNKKTNKIIIGMNQIDLWSGGHQLNRGFKYIIQNNDCDNTNVKLLCVVCKKIQFKNQKSKAYELFKIGFEKNTLCYLKNLKKIITDFFE